MMLIILAVLLPVVRLEIEERPENCQALPATTVHPMNLSDPVKEELQKGLNPKNLSDIDGIATYYIGSPDTSDPEKMLQFTAICISGAELERSPYCYNVTSTKEGFSGSEIPEEQFLSFYRNCSNEPDFELGQTFSTTTIQTQSDTSEN